VKKRVFVLACLLGALFSSFVRAEDRNSGLGESSLDSKISPFSNSKSPSGGIRGLNDPKKRRYRRRLASVKEKRRALWFFGANIKFDGPFAKVAYNAKLSRGLGYSGGLSGYYQTPFFRMGIGSSYQYFRLGRTIDGGGIYVDATNAQFTQTIRYIGVGTQAQFLVEQGGGFKNSSDPSIWGDIGTEILFPISANQTSELSEALQIKADKLWLLLVGGTLDFEVQQNVLIKAAFHLFYNLPSSSEGRLFGLRAQIAFDLGLL